jgi:hypothetical protein
MKSCANRLAGRFYPGALSADDATARIVRISPRELSQLGSTS